MLQGKAVSRATGMVGRWVQGKAGVGRARHGGQAAEVHAEANAAPQTAKGQYLAAA